MTPLQYILIPCERRFSLWHGFWHARSLLHVCVIHAVGLFYTSPGENREVNKPTMRMAPTRMICDSKKVTSSGQGTRVGRKHLCNQYPTPSLRPTSSRWKTFNNDLNQVVASSGFSENKGLGHGLGAQSRGLIKPGIGGSYWRIFVKGMAKQETKLVRGYLPLAWKGSCFSFEGCRKKGEKSEREPGSLKPRLPHLPPS